MATTHAVLIAIDGDAAITSKARLRAVTDGVLARMSQRDLDPDSGKYQRYVLAGTGPETNCLMYIGTTGTLGPAILDIIESLPQELMRQYTYEEQQGQTIDRAEILRRLRLVARSHGVTHTWEPTLDEKVTGGLLLDKFTEL